MDRRTKEDLELGTVGASWWQDICGLAETPWLVGKRSGIRWVPMLKWQEALNKMKMFGRLHNLGVK